MTRSPLKISNKAKLPGVATANNLNQVAQSQPSVAVEDHQMIKVADMKRWTLNWAVSVCEKREFDHSDTNWDPSQNFTQGNAIINREGIVPKFSDNEWHYEGFSGQTSVIPGLLYYVAKNLGAEINVPLSVVGLDDVRRNRNRP